MTEPDPLVDEALGWIVRLKAGEPTRADVDAFQHWRGQSPAHERAFRAAARLWSHTRIAARELDEEEQAAAARRSQGRPRQTLSRRVILGGSVAVAAAASYAVVAPPFGLWPSLEELSADYRTAKGERRKVVLGPDVWLELNTQTSVALRPARNETAVELISGEASVVAKLPSSSSRPFVMLAASGRVTAARADFNARCLGGIVSVTCLDGAVDIELAGKSVGLGKAEQVSYTSAGFAESSPVDIAQAAAWQSGLLIFRDKPLGDVVEEVNRYRPGKIIITNEVIKRRVVNGTFQIDKLGNFVPQVEQLLGARVTSLPGGVVLLS